MWQVRTRHQRGHSWPGQQWANKRDQVRPDHFVRRQPGGHRGHARRAARRGRLPLHVRHQLHRLRHHQVDGDRADAQHSARRRAQGPAGAEQLRDGRGHPRRSPHPVEYPQLRAHIHFRGPRRPAGPPWPH